MAKYDQRFGFITGARRTPVSLGCCGMGALGDDCAAILSEVVRLQGLSKTRSKKEHRAAAASAAAQAQQRYQQCLAARAAAAAQVAVPVAAPTPVTTTPATTLPPVPYVPIYGGGGGGGGPYIPQTTPEMTGGICVDAQGVQVACPQPCRDEEGTPIPCPTTGGNSGFVTPSGQPIPVGTGQVTQTNQVTSDGKPIFYDGRVGQRFFYNTTGQPVYYNASTGQWGVTQDMVQAVQPTQALTPVPYVQMPTGYDGAQAAAQSGQIVDQYGQPVSQAQAAAYTPVQYVQMPDSYEQQAAAAQQGTGLTVDEVSFVGYGRAEYYDQWGPIRVLKLVIPKKAATTSAAAPVAQAAPVQTSQSIYGGQALPGGTMNVEDFTSQYALEGGQW